MKGVSSKYIIPKGLKNREKLDEKIEKGKEDSFGLGSPKTQTFKNSKDLF